MGLFSTPDNGNRTVTQRADRAPWSLWADSFGKLGIRSLQIILVLTVVVAMVYAMTQLTLVLIPTVLALIFASAFEPVMRWMRAKGVPSMLATIIALFATVVVLGLLGALITWAVTNQWSDLVDQAQAGLTQLGAWVQSLPVFADFEDQISEQLAHINETVIGFLTSAQFGSGALAGVSAAANFLTGLGLMIVILFFFLKDGPALWEFVLRPFHGEHYRRAKRIGRKTVDTLGGYVRGTATVAAVDAIGIGIGLAFAGVPLAIPLAVLVFVLAFIPLVGATVAGILAALVALVANGPVNALIVVGIVVLVNQLEGNFLQPVLMGRQLKLHALVVLVALTIGTVLGGLVGAVLAVPIAAVAWGIIQVWDGDNLPARPFRPKLR